MRVLIFITISFFAFESFAQVVTWGKEERLKGKSGVRRIFGATESGFKTITTSSKSFSSPSVTVSSYELPSMKEITDEEIVVESDRETEIDNIFELNGKVYSLNTYIEEKDRKFGVIAKSLNDTSKVVKMHEMPFLRSNLKGEFEYVTNNDKTKLLLVASPPYDKYSKEKFYLKMYGKDMALEWSKEIKLPYLDADFTILKHVVDSSGNVYLLTSYKKLVSQKEQRKNLPADEYLLIVYNKEQNRVKEFAIQLKDKWVNGLSIAINQKENLLLGGFYSNEKKYNVAGTFFLEINPKELAIVQKSLNPFTKEFLGQFFNENQLKKEKQLKDFYFDKLLLGKDGSAYFTAEQNYIRTSSYYDFRTGQTTITYNYHFNDIIVIKINDKAQVDWSQRVAKKQVTTNDKGYYSSFLAVVNDDGGVNLLFNDNPRNFELSEGDRLKIMSNPQKAVVSNAKISAEGKISYNPLFNVSEMATILRPKLHRLLPNGKTLLFTQKGKSYRFATIQFDN